MLLLEINTDTGAYFPPEELVSRPRRVTSYIQINFGSSELELHTVRIIIHGRLRFRDNILEENLESVIDEQLQRILSPKT